MEELTAARLAQVLDEPKSKVLILKKVLWLLGPERTAAILVEALHCEAAGGMLTKDGTRRRTPEGVFFQVVKTRVSREERRQLFGR